MRLTRHYTTPGASPYKDITFVPRDSRITKLDGTVVFEAKGVMVPDFWDQTAVDILAQKYFRRRGCKFGHEGSVYNHPLAKQVVGGAPDLLAVQECPARGFENDLRETIHRIVGCWTHWGTLYGYFSTDEDAQTFYDELSYMLATQRFAPNSPQWFNTGLHFAYGIEGDAQGHYFMDVLPSAIHAQFPEAPVTPALRRSTNAYEHPQTSACFIQSVSDDLVNEGGIMDLWVREARLFKYGSGSGTNYSNIRGTNEPLSGGGVSSGLMSFLKVGDAAGGAIKSGGTSRRAAKMVILDADHPDIEDFIAWKVVEEHKVAMLAAGSRLMAKAWDDLRTAAPGDIKRVARKAVQAGAPKAFVAQCLERISQGADAQDMPIYDLDWEGAGYGTVSAQNANNSVRVTDAFMDAVAANTPWALLRRVDGKIAKQVAAGDLWDKIATATWMCADPGLQFHDTFNGWHTGAASGPIRGTNPCSEYAYLDDTACNLASINLRRYNSGAAFDVRAFTHTSFLVTIALEITVAMSQYPSATLAKNSYEHRTLGLGYANLGAMLMDMGLPYDSHEGRAISAAISAVMTGAGYRVSAMMADEFGPFPAYKQNEAHVLRVLHNHAVAATAIAGSFQGLNPAVQTRSLPLPQTLGSHVDTYAKLLTAAKDVWSDVVALAPVHGVRNAQISVLAPTGTIGLVMGCDTTGVEPDFSLVKFKKLAGGGYMKLVNGSVPDALAELGYTPEQIEDITDYATGKDLMRTHYAEDLLRHGFTRDDVEAWASALKTAFDPTMVLPMDLLAKLYDPNALADMLLELGGRATLEGAPHLQQAHLDVFDCANKCGRFGTRYIHPMGHLQMMAAVQPFISGSISKTVNLPSDCTITDIRELYYAAWRMGIKAVAFYRDGSKLSQPLATNLELLDGADVLMDEEVPTPTKVAVVAEALTKIVRKKLPTRRTGYTQAARIDGTKLYVRTGNYQDGTLGEIFIDMHKEGAAFRSLMNSFAIAISIGLQYGVPLEEYCDAYLFTKFEPQGMVIGHDNIKMTTSVLDFIFRDLAITYLGRHDLAHVKPEQLLTESGAAHPMSANMAPGVVVIEEETVDAELTAQANRPVRSAQDIAREQGYTGDACSACGHFTLVRSGTCQRCSTCGTTTGCS